MDLHLVGETLDRQQQVDVIRRHRSA